MKKFILPFVMAIMFVFVFVVAMPVSAAELSHDDLCKSILSDSKVDSSTIALFSQFNYQLVCKGKDSNGWDFYILIFSESPFSFSDNKIKTTGRGVYKQIQYSPSQPIGGGIFMGTTGSIFSNTPQSFSLLFESGFQAPFSSTFDIKYTGTEDVFFSKTSWSNYPKLARQIPKTMNKDFLVLLPIGLVIFGALFLIWLIPSVIRRFL